MKRILRITAVILLSALAATASAQKPKVRTSAKKEKTTIQIKAGQNADAAGKKQDKTAKATGNVQSNGKKVNASNAKAAANKNQKAVTKKEIALFNTMSRYMAIKTNVAYDAVAILNLAYEIEVAQHLTVEIPVAWSLWDWKPDNGLRTVALQPGVKYHFGEIADGHAVGADVAVAWFNMRHDQHRYQDTGRPLTGISLNYTYTKRLGRGWAAEVTVGAGYLNMAYNTYYNVTNGALLSKRTRNYVGPTRVALTLSYTL
ncbi:MAG: DUF3575 domain-containing protein [Muribaculaceae bacterium]|nr:DUF3575 domain-containing protein [Muribaculaceae bacterium]